MWQLVRLLYSGNLVGSKEYNGLVDQITDFHSESFDVTKVPLSIIRFMKIQQSMSCNQILNGLVGSAHLHFVMRK